MSLLNLRASALAMSAAAALSFGALAARAAAEEQSQRLVVVELFTSQGCNTCPPADKFLGELAERDDVIALALHVDYWDYLGWKDPFASPSYTQRQRDYAMALGARRTYTPQMVVQGDVGLVGSHRDAVKMAIESMSAEPPLVDVALTREGDTLRIDLASTPSGDSVRLAGPLEVVLIGYDGPHAQRIDAGENGGETLLYHNVARDYRIVGAWPGGDGSLTADVDGAMQGYAVFVQVPGPGRIVGAEKIDF